MGKFDVTAMRYMEGEHFRVLMAIEMGMKNHELVPLQLIAAVAGIHRGATNKILGHLIKNRLVGYERGKRYDGYRLTVLGYDYLALRALCSRDIVGSVGNQIGIGKESDVFIGGDPDRNDVVLKFHRLGRTCFRKIKEKRDYHKRRHYCSWLYLSRIAALKEFCFLKALHERKFPVPKPVDVCRHVVVMGLVDGLTLCHVDELPNIGEMYDKLMALIMRLARYGVIHGDFNEFNLMISKDGTDPVMIDFPQMVSIDHPNADFYFNRDVQCVRDYFRRKFNFECPDYPKFEDIERRYTLDVDLAASGFTKEMAVDLLQAYDKGNFDAHLEDEKSEDEDEEDEEEDEEEEQKEQAKKDDFNPAEYDNEELEAIAEEGEEQKQTLSRESRFKSWLETAQTQLKETTTADHLDAKETLPELLPMDDEQQAKYKAAIAETEKRLAEMALANEDDEDSSDGEYEKATADKDELTSAAGDHHRLMRGKVTQARSVYSTGSTIAPSDIRKRLMKEKTRVKKEKMKAKGNQCAIQRGRKTNQDVIKEYAGWAF
uniref:Serine/threonine-protein kinase RIO2 n=1 Tax=Panagrellus redivivus TaxID=6233 RepID=A0A7E4VKS2_PANRE